MAKLLPLRPAPRAREIFASWLTRVAAAYNLSLSEFTRTVWTKYLHEFPRTTDKIASTAISRKPGSTFENKHLPLVMSSATGLSVRKLDSLKLSSKSHHYLKHLLLSPRYTVPLANDLPGNIDPYDVPDQYCPECLSSSFHFRRPWRVACLCYCSFHHRPLLDRCPRCQGGLQFWSGKWLHRYVLSDYTTLNCQHCHFELASTPREPLGQEDETLLCLITSIVEGKICFQWPQQPSRQSSVVSLALHLALEAVLQTDYSRSERGTLLRRTSSNVKYARESCYRRFEILRIVLDLLQRLRSPIPRLSFHQKRAWKYIAPHTRQELLETVQVLLPAFREYRSNALSRSKKQAVLFVRGVD